MTMPKGRKKMMMERMKMSLLLQKQPTLREIFGTL
jgi:hypothetical protein